MSTPAAPNPRGFERAIRRLPRVHVCCCALDPSWIVKWTYGQPLNPELGYFRALFRPHTAINDCWWPHDDIGVRVIALQLAAEVARDERKRATKGGAS